MLYELIPNMPEVHLRPLVERFDVYINQYPAFRPSHASMPETQRNIRNLEFAGRHFDDVVYQSNIPVVSFENLTEMGGHPDGLCRASSQNENLLCLPSPGHAQTRPGLAVLRVARKEPARRAHGESVWADAADGHAALDESNPQTLFASRHSETEAKLFCKRSLSTLGIHASATG